MATALGINDVKNVIRIPGTWDLTYLKQWSTAEGVTYDQVVARLAAVLTVFNASLTGGYWGRYLSTTTGITTRYPIGSDNAMLPEIAEHGRPDPIIGEETGHMLPMKDYGGSLGWTYMSMRRGNMDKFDLDMRRLVERGQNTWARKIIGRLFTSVYEAVGTGKSVPFADGGTADSTYVPPAYEGATFSSSHTHFLRNTADANGRTAALTAMVNHLWEHGIMPPYDLVIPEADVASWVAQAEYKKPVRTALITAGVETRGVVNEDEYLGLFESGRGWGYIKPTPRLPTAYAGMFKPMGYNNSLSPVVVRYEEGYPLGMTLVGDIKQFPLQEAIAYFTFGAGIANRLAGVASYFAASGNYVDPAIS